MLVKDILNKTNKTFSFEFFPPKSEEAWEKLFLTISHLMPLKPSWVLQILYNYLRIPDTCEEYFTNTLSSDKQRSLKKILFKTLLGVDNPTRSD